MSATRELAAQWLERVRAFERSVVFAAFVVMTGVVFADVVARELGGSGLPWARQTGVWANIVVAMFGVGLASGSGSHLRPRFADRWLPAAWDPVVDRIGELVTAIFCGAFAALVVALAYESGRFGEQSAILRLPVWPMQLVIAIAFALAGLRHVAYAVWPRLKPEASSAFVTETNKK